MLILILIDGLMDNIYEVLFSALQKGGLVKISSSHPQVTPPPPKKKKKKKKSKNGAKIGFF